MRGGIYIYIFIHASTYIYTHTHIYTYIHRWENWMQYTQSRLVPKFTENGFDIIGDNSLF
jgi:hypothetical protein